MNKIKVKKIIKKIIPFALIIAVVISGSLAYLISTNTKTNTFLLGNIKIELWEAFDTDNDGTVTAKNSSGADINYLSDSDLWEYGYNTSGDEMYGPKEAPPVLKHINIGPYIDKAPWVRNTGTNDAYIYAAVSLPYVRADELESVNLSNESIVDLWHYDDNGDLVQGVNPSWKLLGTYYPVSFGGSIQAPHIVHDKQVLLFYYDNPSQEAGMDDRLAPGEKTPNIFDAFTIKESIDSDDMKNILHELQEYHLVEDDKFNIDINTYAIQADLYNGMIQAEQAWTLCAKDAGWKINDGDAMFSFYQGSVSGVDFYDHIYYFKSAGCIAPNVNVVNKNAWAPHFNDGTADNYTYIYPGDNVNNVLVEAGYTAENIKQIDYFMPVLTEGSESYQFISYGGIQKFAEAGDFITVPEFTNGDDIRAGLSEWSSKKASENQKDGIILKPGDLIYRASDSSVTEINHTFDSTNTNSGDYYKYSGTGIYQWQGNYDYITSISSSTPKFNIDCMTTTSSGYTYANGYANLSSYSNYKSWYINSGPRRYGNVAYLVTTSSSSLKTSSNTNVPVGLYVRSDFGFTSVSKANGYGTIVTYNLPGSYTVYRINGNPYYRVMTAYSTTTSNANNVSRFTIYAPVVTQENGDNIPTGTYISKYGQNQIPLKVINLSIGGTAQSDVVIDWNSEDVITGSDGNEYYKLSDATSSTNIQATIVTREAYEDTSIQSALAPYLSLSDDERPAIVVSGSTAVWQEKNADYINENNLIISEVTKWYGVDTGNGTTAALSSSDNESNNGEPLVAKKVHVTFRHPYNSDWEYTTSQNCPVRAPIYHSAYKWKLESYKDFSSGQSVMVYPEDVFVNADENFYTYSNKYYDEYVFVAVQID